jgi:CBS domain-containing protein
MLFLIFEILFCVQISLYLTVTPSTLKPEKRVHEALKEMFDFNIIILSVLGIGALAFSFVEYALTRKKKHE